MILSEKIPADVLSKVIDIFNFYQALCDIDLTPVFVEFYENYPENIDGLSLTDTLKFRSLLKLNMRKLIDDYKQKDCEKEPELYVF